MKDTGSRPGDVEGTGQPRETGGHKVAHQNQDQIVPDPCREHPQLLEAGPVHQLVGGKVDEGGGNEKENKDAKAQYLHVLASGRHGVPQLVVYRADQQTKSYKSFSCHITRNIYITSKHTLHSMF